jgi:hypothetical protein
VATLLVAAGCGNAGEVGGDPPANAARSMASAEGRGTSGEVACPAASCAALPSGSYDILSCHGGSLLVRCSGGRPRCFACKAGYTCRFNNGGNLAHDFCSANGIADDDACVPCNATARRTGTIWGCEEQKSRLVRCVNGCLETEPCADGCTYNNGGTGRDDVCGKRSSGGGWGWPVSGFTITQDFTCGSCNWYPWNAAWGCCLHDAVDLAAPAYTPIVAAAAGTVFAAGWGNVEGYYVQIDHGGGVTTYYGHMAQQPTVVQGQWVARGDYLGPMGATGLATGPHTHFMVRVNGVAQNPRSYMPPL